MILTKFQSSRCPKNNYNSSNRARRVWGALGMRLLIWTSIKTCRERKNLSSSSIAWRRIVAALKINSSRTSHKWQRCSRGLQRNQLKASAMILVAGMHRRVALPRASSNVRSVKQHLAWWRQNEFNPSRSLEPSAWGSTKSTMPLAWQWRTR